MRLNYFLNFRFRFSSGKFLGNSKMKEAILVLLLFLNCKSKFFEGKTYSLLHFYLQVKGRKERNKPKDAFLIVINLLHYYNIHYHLLPKHRK